MARRMAETTFRARRSIQSQSASRIFGGVQNISGRSSAKLASRVTGLVEFSTVGWLFTSGSSFYRPNFWVTLSDAEKVLYSFWQKEALPNFWAIFSQTLLVTLLAAFQLLLLLQTILKQKKWTKGTHYSTLFDIIRLRLFDYGFVGLKHVCYFCT
jgi:hypothetical protein